MVAKKSTPKRATAKRASAKRSTAKRTTAKRSPAKKTTTRKPPLVANGMRLVAVFGPFGSRALVDMSADRAEELFDQPLSSSLAPTRVIDATLTELAALAMRKPGLDTSAAGAAAVALAYEIDSPFNSATSKSLCVKQLRDTMAELNELAPEQATSRLDELSAKRADRQQKVASG